MRVLSLFDGISCGMVALERAGISVEKYDAYEIEESAIKISSHNYPMIEHKGDVFKAEYQEGEFDLLIGGSPCTYWSISRTNAGRETTSSGLGWELFSQYVRALKESKPKYFLYENNYSMSTEIKEEITKALGVEPILINSALLSAQSRKRLYWTNIPFVYPQDKGVKLQDIVESGIVDRAKSLCVARRTIGNKGSQEYMARRYFEKSFAQMVFEEGYSKADRTKGYIRPLTVLEMERLQTLPDDYTKIEGVTETQRGEAIGNGWTVDVIAHILKGIKEEKTMNEIIISQHEIKCDFADIKNHLDEQLNAYRNLIFTEDTKKDAKNTVAELRKEQKAFKDRIKEVKAEWMKPFDDFYEKACELSDMYDVPIKFINEQIDAFENKRIEEKKAEISSIYKEMIPEEEWMDILPLAKIYNSKWENATFTSKAIREEIMTRKIQAKDAIATIKSMQSEKEAQAIEMFKRDFDLTACIVYLNNYERQKQEIMAQEQARIQKEAEERIRAEERAKIEAERKQAEEIAKAQAEIIDNLIPEDKGSPIAWYSYNIAMTAEAKEKLEMFMNSIGIEFEELRF